PVACTGLIDGLASFGEDPGTELSARCGWSGGEGEERGADFTAESVTRPIVGYTAGFTGPRGKTMGHAGAIVSGSQGTAKAKAEALEAKGVRVARTPTEVAELAAGLLREASSPAV